MRIDQWVAIQDRSALHMDNFQTNPITAVAYFTKNVNPTKNVFPLLNITILNSFYWRIHLYKTFSFKPKSLATDLLVSLSSFGLLGVVDTV